MLPFRLGTIETGKTIKTKELLFVKELQQRRNALKRQKYLYKSVHNRLKKLSKLKENHKNK